MDLKKAKSTFDKLFTDVWLISVNARYYQTWLGKIYTWSTFNLFRFVMYIQGIRKGKSSIELYAQEAGLNRDIFSGLSTVKTSETVIPMDKGQLLDTSANLFRLEVCLISHPSCQSEIFALLVHDNVPVDKLGDIIFYKTYYQAARSHGQSHRLSFQQCLSVIHKAHGQVRFLLGHCKQPVTWQDDFIFFDQMSQHLRIPLNIKSDEKAKLGKHWSRIGFQGDDPCSDFRGVGKLGLQQLHHFCMVHPLYAQRMVEESGSLMELPAIDQPWYPFAVCSIHVTRLVCQLLEGGTLERNLLQAQLHGDSGIQDFLNSIYCFTFVQCHLDWATGVDKGEITSVFQFEEFFKDFSTFLTRELRTKVWNNDDFHPHSKWW